jgi:hypothetical protein
MRDERPGPRDLKHAAYDEAVDLDLLERTLAGAGQPPFRARQVWAWAARGAGSYEPMRCRSRR